MQLIKNFFYILAFAFIILSCSKNVNHLEKENIEEIISVIINKKSFPLPPPPIFLGDSIVNVIDKKTIDSLKSVNLTVAIYPIVNSLLLNVNELTQSQKNNKTERLLDVRLKNKVNINLINKMSQHNIIFGDTIILKKSKDWKEYDLLYYFSNISLSSNLDYAKVSVGVSRSALWGQGYDLYLKKEKNEGKWVIEKTIEGEVW